MDTSVRIPLATSIAAASRVSFEAAVASRITFWSWESLMYIVHPICKQFGVTTKIISQGRDCAAALPGLYATAAASSTGMAWALMLSCRGICTSSTP